MRRRQVGHESMDDSSSNKHFSGPRGGPSKSTREETSLGRLVVQALVATVLVGGIYYYAEVYDGKTKSWIELILVLADVLLVLLSPLFKNSHFPAPLLLLVPMIYHRFVSINNNIFKQ